MSVGTFTVYSNAVLNISTAAINLNSDTIVMVLVTAAYTPAVNTDATWANVSSNEVATGNGYTQGGQALTSQSCTLTTATVTFTSATAGVSWSAATFTCKYAVLVRRAGGSLASTDKLVGYADLSSGGGSVTGQGGTFTVQPNASGWFTLTHSP